MSFFDDDVDEPRAAPRTSTRSRRPSGGGRRPPSEQQAIQVRRGVAAVVILAVLVVIVLLVHSCQVSARNTALRNYTNNVSSLIQQSNSTGQTLFHLLGSASSSNVTGLQNSLNEASGSAQSQLDHANKLSVPDQMKQAHQKVVLALQMRRDGIQDIAGHIQQALGTSTSKAAVNAIAVQMALFYASDAIYKNYATHEIAAALHSAGIAVGGANGETIAAGQFLPSIQWVLPDYVAQQLHAASPTTSGHFTPGLHGHSLDSVSVAGTTLQTGSTNTITASPAPSFTLSFTNGGHFTEHNVVCKVSVSGTSDGGQTTVPQTTSGQSTTCTVQLKSAPARGNATVVATVQPVQGEKNTSNNTLSFPVTFQ